MENKKSPAEQEFLGRDITKLVVETDEKNPITIAVITNNGGIDVTDGYRVRLVPRYAN